jgi:hypothetical protein
MIDIIFVSSQQKHQISNTTTTNEFALTHSQIDSLQQDNRIPLIFRRHANLHNLLEAMLD